MAEPVRIEVECRFAGLFVHDTGETPTGPSETVETNYIGTFVSDANGNLISAPAPPEAAEELSEERPTDPA